MVDSVYIAGVNFQDVGHGTGDAVTVGVAGIISYTGGGGGLKGVSKNTGSTGKRIDGVASGAGIDALELAYEVLVQVKVLSTGNTSNVADAT